MCSCPARLLWFSLFAIMGRALALPWSWTMASLFLWPGRQLKETPIREASISRVGPRGHAQVRLLFMSAKPIKTLQPTSLTPTCPALMQFREEFLPEPKSRRGDKFKHSLNRRVSIIVLMPLSMHWIKKQSIDLFFFDKTGNVHNGKWNQVCQTNSDHLAAVTTPKDRSTRRIVSRPPGYFAWKHGSKKN